MKKQLLILFPLFLTAETFIVPDDYKITKDEKIDYIYSDEYETILPDIKAYQEELLTQYEKDFGFKLDDKLQVVLASLNNQEANGFSTQVPFNMQVFYGSGSMFVDYFCESSWLKGLINHETTHNFQLNPKENWLAKASHKIFGNVGMIDTPLIPLFPIPNSFENPFILEGNAVLNESRFGNGGRLYSGYALAEVVAMARAGEIRPELMYNKTLKFPYEEKNYIVGGFFQKFLMQKYGIKKVNSYFKEYSNQYFPIFTDAVFEKEFDKTFTALLDEFVEDIKEKHKSFRVTEGKIVATSKSASSLNSDDEEIYVRVSDLLSKPKILKFNKQTKEVAFKSGSWGGGKAFKIEQEYFTQTFSKTSPAKLTMGLFNENLFLKEGTSSKVIQGFMPNGKQVYFDIATSIESPHIYVGDKFYDTSNSSVYVDKEGNIYYFKQDKHKRTLYKNKKPLFSYVGHYGFVTDVDENGAIYFIAKSKDGSSAYRYNNSKIERVTQGDDVIDIKLINSQEAVVMSISAKGFNYQIVTLEPQNQEVSTTNYELEDNLSKVLKKSELFQSKEALKSNDYNALKEIRFSSIEPSFEGNEEGSAITLKANFEDPLNRNSLSTILSFDSNKTVVGAEYSNMTHQLEYGATLYGVEHQDNYVGTEDDHGYSAYLRLPFLDVGYWYGSAMLDYTKAFDSIYRKPLTLSMNISNYKQYGISRYANHSNQLSLFASRDRDTDSFGIEYSWMHDLGWQSYIGFDTSYLSSNQADNSFEKGIRVSDNLADIQNEKAQVIMPTLNQTLFAKEAITGEISLYKTFDIPLYAYHLPISLQRENFYIKHKIYDFELQDGNKQYKETTFGLTNDTIILNQLKMPITTEWIYNEDVVDKLQFKFFLGKRF